MLPKDIIIIQNILRLFLVQSGNYKLSLITRGSASRQSLPTGLIKITLERSQCVSEDCRGLFGASDNSAKRQELARTSLRAAI